MMTTTSDQQKTLDQKNTKRAWEIHQNADTLLHSRLSAFAIAQSFLVSGHVLSVNGLLIKATSYTIFLANAIAVLGVVSSVLFLMICSRLVMGLERLKKDYLLPNDPVYKHYLLRITGMRVLDEGLLRWVIPMFFPGCMLIFWLVVVVRFWVAPPL
jgi:hypothetical protein